MKYPEKQIESLRSFLDKFSEAFSVSYEELAKINSSIEENKEKEKELIKSNDELLKSISEKIKENDRVSQDLLKLKERGQKDDKELSELQLILQKERDGREREYLLHEKALKDIDAKVKEKEEKYRTIGNHLAEERRKVLAKERDLNVLESRLRKQFYKLGQTFKL